MASVRAETLMGRIAVRAELITMDQLAEATREQGVLGATKNIGDILVEKGFLTPEDLVKLVELQKRIVARAREKEEARRRALKKPAWDIEDESDNTDSCANLPVRRDPDATSVSVARLPEIPEEPPTATPPTASEQAEAVQAARAAVQKAVAATPIAMTSLDDVLHRGVEAGASDMHIHAGALIRLRVRGELVELGSEPLDPETSESMVLSSLTPEQRERFAENGELDFCYTLPELGRFRANVYRQLRGVDGVYRHIPAQVPSLQDLGLPTSLAKFTNFHQGMVLITGPASCGKSSTMAALVDLINEERSEHILLIEDPIEYLHSSKRCLVNQRNVHRHTESFARALRGALREDPDVIVIGELRDRETISLALTAAETGNFVLATLHTDSAIRTVDRLVGAFPPNQQGQVRAMLSESLRAVISQRLVTNKHRTTQIPAMEILIINKAVGKMIRDNKTFQLPSVLQTGGAHGMCLLDNSLADLIDADVITREEALRHCSEPKRFED